MNKSDLIDIIFNEDLIALEKIAEAKDFNVNFLDEKLNITPLICAIDTNNEKIVDLVLKLGADPNFTSEGLSLPLIHAIEIAVEAEEYSEEPIEISITIIKNLIQYGAKINAVNFDGKTPIEFSLNYHPPAYELFSKMLESE
jgi:ankyrin repeat protein